MSNHIKQIKGSKRGVAILYAVLLVSVIMSVGLLLIDIITKQIILSSVGKNSQFAYYAANVGKECAYFWDTQPHAFDYKYGEDGVEIPGSRTDKINCAEAVIDISYKDGLDDNGDGTTDYYTADFITGGAVGIPIDTDTNAKLCARVTVTKTADDSGNFTTEILSRGYNTSCNLVDQSGGRIIERAVILE